MGDSFYNPGSRTNTEAASAISGKRASKLILVASAPKSASHLSLNQISSHQNGKTRRGHASHVALFLVKVGVLETVRRFSNAKCPFLWSGLQALQVLCFPPFKWLHRWDPFRKLVKVMQRLSRPLLVLSIATVFSDQAGCTNVITDGNEDPHNLQGSPAVPESQSRFPTQCDPDARIDGEAQSPEPSTNWLRQLHAELENEGISLPQRITVDELHRFCSAANGDFSCLLSSVKKTISWRESYKILSGEELEPWSNLVFWHGFDVQNRPCLIIRLGLACTSLAPRERSCFIQAVVSQVDYGVLHLVHTENPQITVLLDCDGVSLRFPMQMVRSCSAILQENFPHRLGHLFIVRLPPVVRVLAQTFIQVLKTGTRRKLKIVGRMYRKSLSEDLQTFPSYLGGKCECSKCTNIDACNMRPLVREMTNQKQEDVDVCGADELPPFGPICRTTVNGSCYQFLRSAIVGILILWVLVAFISVIHVS